MAVDLGQVRKGMHMRSLDGEDLGRVAEVWLGTDPTSATARCDEAVCSRIEVHRGVLRRRVLYVPYNAVAGVSGEGVILGVDRTRARRWTTPPRWLPKPQAGKISVGGDVAGPPGSL
jgi:hypothetical protein